VKRKKTKIRALIFDIGGVLQLGEERTKGVHKYVSRKFRISLDQYLDAIDTTYAKSIEGKLSEERVIEILAKNLKTTKKRLVRLYKKAYKKNFKLNKELLKFVKKAKKQGIATAIISDMWHLSKRSLVLKKFYRIFKPVILSCDIKIRKPNPEIYRLTLEKLKIQPEEAVFIDNREWNIKPAKKLGIKTILFKNNKQTIKELNKIVKWENQIKK